jgi:hypothetical protein
MYVRGFFFARSYTYFMEESLQTQVPAGEVLPCPHCGYDLRETTGDQCSECGRVIDRATLGLTGYPWSNRHNIRNYLKTVWLITINSRRLRYETLKNQNLAHARSCHRITTLLVAVTLAGSCAAIVVADPLIFAIPRPFPRPATWRDDLIVPWAAGATLRPVLPLMFLRLAVHLMRIHHRLFRLRDAPAHSQDRAFAIAAYTIAPMFWLLPLAIFLAGGASLILAGIIEARVLIMYLLSLPVLAAILLFPLTLFRILQWTLRVRHQSGEHALLIVPHVLALWLFVLVFYLGFLPWCIGLVWLAVDSLR